MERNSVDELVARNGEEGGLDQAGGNQLRDHPAERPPAVLAGAGSVLAMATSACGSDGSSTSPSGGGTGAIGGAPAPTVLRPASDQEAARFALHASLSVSTSVIEELRADGYEAWLNRQISTPNDQSAEQYFESGGLNEINERRYYVRAEIGDFMIWSQLLSGGNQVRRRAALALSEILVVSLNTLNIRWPAQAIGQYWDILNQHAFGNYRELLEDITLNPAMGAFLNTRGNQKADPATGRVPDENFGREIMQLFSIGLFELNPDGSLQADSSGNPIETYSNEDVTGIAKSFTGYDFDFGELDLVRPAADPNLLVADAVSVRRPMTADGSRQIPRKSEVLHSPEAKSFLGSTIPAGTGAAETLRRTLDILFNHPNVGPFLSERLIQRLVTSNPSRVYVRRVASVFNNNGSGTRGDMAAVFKAILLDEEALSQNTLTDPTFGKLREPMLRFVQWARTFKATSNSGAWLIEDLSDDADRLGQSPLRPPSVFNFFRPGFVPAGSQAADNGLLAPEFQLVNEVTTASYVNFIERTIDGRGAWMGDVTADYSEEVAIAQDTDALIERLDLLLTAGQLSPNTKDTIRAALNAQSVTQSSSTQSKVAQVYRAVLLVMASTDYLVQK